MNHYNKFSELSELIKHSYLGEIVSINGSDDYPGRVKIRVYGLFDGKDLGKIDDVDLPYAYPLYPLSFGSKSGGQYYSTPKVGTVVRVVFDPDIYHPRYYSTEYLEPELNGLIKDAPESFHSLLYDTDAKVKFYHSTKTGLLMFLDDSTINIKPDNSIIINHKGSSSTIELRGADIDITANSTINISTPDTVTINSSTVHANGSTTKLGANPTYSIPLGEQLMLCLKGLATIINAKLPVDTTALSLVNQMESAILSKTCKTT